MAYTYLITGATSDVGRALIERLLADAPADTTVLAQGCGDLEKLADLCARFPDRCAPLMWTCPTAPRWTPLCRCWHRPPLRRPISSICPPCPWSMPSSRRLTRPALTAILEIQVHSAVRLCRAVLPAMAKAKFGRVLFISRPATPSAARPRTPPFMSWPRAPSAALSRVWLSSMPASASRSTVWPQHDGNEFLEGHPDLIVQAAAEENPMGRNATPADVVPAMAFLLSDEAGSSPA